MRVKVDPIVAIQAGQLMEYIGIPDVFQHLLAQALQRNLEALPPDMCAPHITTKDTVWRGQRIDFEALRTIKELSYDIKGEA